MDTGKICPVCGEPLRGNYCWTCDDDKRSERREFYAWKTYVAEYREKMSLIAQTAERVCHQRELELIAADLWEWPEQRTADHLGLSIEELRSFREEIHEKIRAGIGEETVSELSKRRHYQSPKSR
jgi:hypothetical protein